MSRHECRVYVGNLPPAITAKDIEDVFYRCGKILKIDLKNRRGPPFAFVEFEDPRDAEDAISRRDGYDYDGYKIRVEFPKGTIRARSGGSGGGGSGGFRGDGIGRPVIGPPPRRSQYRVLVSGLPPSASWQDLKDHMRGVGDVCFADVQKHNDGSGIVEFRRYEDMKNAIKNRDDSKFRSHEGETSYIRVMEDYRGAGCGEYRGRSRSRSYSPARRRRSPSYSPIRSASSSRSRS